MNRFIIVTLIYQLIVVLFYNKAARFFTYLNKVAYFLALLVFIYFIKIDSVQNSFELRYLVPIILTSLLFLIYDTNKGFAQHSLRNKFFPTLIAFIVLITHFVNVEIVNYALILSASYDFLITTERKEIGSHKKYIGPIFILSTQLLGLLFNFGVDNDMLFIIYWIVVAKLFPFSLLRDANNSIDEHYLSRSILILNLAFGNIAFSVTSMSLLAGTILISLVMMYFVKTEMQSYLSYRSIIMSSIILLCILTGKTNNGVFVTSILWADFYFMGLAVSRMNTTIPDNINRKIGSAIYFIIISGVLVGANHFVIVENLRELFLKGQINIAVLMLVPFALSAAFYFSRNEFKATLAERIRKFDHFDTFISQLIILIGVILSV